MDGELLHFHALVIGCTQPEELFGTDPNQVKALYYKFAKVSHVDKYQRSDEKRLAHIAFTKLNALHTLAIEKIRLHIYGTTATPPKKDLTPAMMHSKKGIYIIKAGLARGDVSNIYRALLEDTGSVIIKMAQTHHNNPFLEVEAAVLTHLNKAAEGTTSYKHFIPTLLDSFSIKVAPDNAIRRVNVFNTSEGFRLLTDVAAQFPEGIVSRHFVWMFKRVLSTLSFAHSQGIIHGAVLPTHVMIHPETHAVRVVDWCFAVSKDKPLIAMSNQYNDWYPPEVIQKKPLSAACDIYMAAMCMSYVLGSQRVHPKFRRLLDSCMIKNPFRRPQSAWEVRKEIETLSEEIFGPRQYVKLQMA